jgi:hypothetical protein
VIIAAVLAAALLAAVCIFQLALALGAPFGAAAWGGRHEGVLPMRLRIASGVAGLIVYPLVIAVVLTAAGIIGLDWLPVDPALTTLVLGVLLTLGAVANFASRSRPERIWGPVALAAAICCIIVGLAA